MLTMIRAPSRRGEAGSDTTEEIVRDGKPYYFKQNSGRMVMARKITRRHGDKKVSLLGQAFGIDEPKRRAPINTKRKRKNKPAQHIPHPPQPTHPTLLPQQQFSGFLQQPPMPFTPVIPQQPFPDPNLFVPASSGFPAFYSVPGFPPPQAPAPAPMRWTFQPKAPKQPSVEELLKAESDFNKRERSKSRRREGEHNDRTETKTTTTTTVTKHICSKCRRDRSVKYHLDHPIKAGEIPTPGFCRKCRRNATSTSGSSSGDSDDGGSRRHGTGGRGRRREKRSKTNGKRQHTSRIHSIEVLSRNKRRDTSQSKDYRDEIIFEEEEEEEEVVHERKTAPKGQARRSDNIHRASAPRSYPRAQEEDLSNSDATPRPRGEPKVRINITNRSSSATPSSLADETQEKSVHFDQPAGRPNLPKTASIQDINSGFRYVYPIHPTASSANLPGSDRISRESLPSLRTRDNAQRRRSERVYAEPTYDHDTSEQVYEQVPRRRSGENIVVVEPQREQARSRKESTTPHTRPNARFSDENITVIETERERPVRSRKTVPSTRRYTRSSDEDIIVVETEKEIPIRPRANVPRTRPNARPSDENIIVVETENERPIRPRANVPRTRPNARSSDENTIFVETHREAPRSRADSTTTRPLHRPRTRPFNEDFIITEAEHEHPRIRTESRNVPRLPQERRRSPVRIPIRTSETYITSEVDQHGRTTKYEWTISNSSSSPPRGFIPNAYHPSTSVRHSSGSFRHSSDSSEEYNRANAMLHQNLPDPGPPRHQRTSYRRSSRGFMDGAYTPPQVPDPPISYREWESRDTGGWESRDTGRSARGTQSRGRDFSNSRSYATQVPQHRSTPRGRNQPWMDASSIDQFGQPRQARSRSYGSQESPGSMVTQSDSLKTPSSLESLYELEDSPESAPVSKVPRPACLHEATESGNEIESTSATPSPKAIVVKETVDSSRRRGSHNRAEVTNSQARAKYHTTSSSSQRHNDQLGKYSSYVEYVERSATTKGSNSSKDRSFTSDDNNTIFDDATDLTLRNPRSRIAMNERMNAQRRREPYARKHEFEPTPEQSKKNFGGTATNANANANNSGDQSWDKNGNATADQSRDANSKGGPFWDANTTANTKANESINGNQSWDASTTWNQSWGNDINTNANTNGDQSWGADANTNVNTNGDQSWDPDTNANGNDFWPNNTATETVLPDIGAYSGPPSANASAWNLNANLNNNTATNGFDWKKGFAPTSKGRSGGDGNDDAEDEWGPVPTFSSLDI